MSDDFHVQSTDRKECIGWMPGRKVEIDFEGLGVNNMELWGGAGTRFFQNQAFLTAFSEQGNFFSLLNSRI